MGPNKEVERETVVLRELHSFAGVCIVSNVGRSPPPTTTHPRGIRRQAPRCTKLESVVQKE